MRRLTLLLIGIVALIGASCTHNNGNIGFWFGTWQCESISIDGVEQTDYARNMFFKFQADVCDIITTYPHNEYRQHFAQFKEQGDGTITLDFTYSADGDFRYEFDPPTESLLEKGVTVMKYHKNGSRLTLSFDKGGQTITYSLKKQ